jgi:hypothetical protein
MADAGIWIIWDHCVLLGGRASEALGPLEAARKGMGREEGALGKRGQVGQLEPAAGWEDR